MSHPQRSSTVYAEVLNDELCLYNREGRTVHALNPSLAQVWQMCDGHTSPADMADRLRADLALELDAHQADALVWSGLSQLSAAHLLQGELPQEASGTTLTRREVLKTGWIFDFLVPCSVNNRRVVCIAY